MFVLVSAEGNGAAREERVVGISAIEAAVGLAEPWYNYHVGTLVHASRALDVYTVAPTLFLANDHTGHTELCSLFLDHQYRQGRNGPLLAKCRLLFIAEFAQRFAPKVIAEMRGRLDPDGRSPFWEGLGRHFFAMEYSTADYLTGIGQKSFVAELMPKHPVYVNLLSPGARGAIGAVHADTEPARRMLEQEGFRYEGYVDIFDAGPTLECFRDDIHAVRTSRILTVTVGESDPLSDSLTDDIVWLVCNRAFEDFRALLASAPGRATACRCCRTRRARWACAKATPCARCRCRAATDDRVQLRRHSGADAQLLGTGAGQSCGGTPCAAAVQSAGGGVAGAGEDARAGTPGTAAGGAAAAGAPGAGRAARTGLLRQRRRRAGRGGSERAAPARRVGVGSEHVGRECGDGQRRRGHRRRSRPLHAGQPDRPLSPVARGRHHHPGAARDLRRPRALRRARPVALRRAVRRRGRGQPHALRRPVAGRRRISWCMAGTASAAARFRAALAGRQTLEASAGGRASTRTSLPNGRCTRNSIRTAIDAGVFHNDVIAVGHRAVLFCHERAWVDQHATLAALARAVGPAFTPIVVRDAEVPLADAVATYLFNSQLVDRPGGGLLLVAPAEISSRPKVAQYVETLTGSDGPIREVLRFDLRESMRNGGGPACLRLRVPLSDAERAAVRPNVFLDEALATALESWIRTHYRDRLAPADLADPLLLDESRRALDALTRLLRLPAVYPFQD